MKTTPDFFQKLEEVIQELREHVQAGDDEARPALVTLLDLMKRVEVSQ
jgi:hypothetical protein